MPRGNKNIGEYNAKRTPKKRKENASKAGKASVIARREKADLRERCSAWLECEAGRDTNGNILTGADLMIQIAAIEVSKGNAKFWELIRDTSGQKPTDKVDLNASVNVQESAERIKAAMEKVKKSDG